MPPCESGDTLGISDGSRAFHLGGVSCGLGTLRESWTVLGSVSLNDATCGSGDNLGISDDPQKLQVPLTSVAESVLTPIFPIFPNLGNLYHHLPWFGDKPVAAVTSLWEDAGHRWDSLNLLRALCQHLVRPRTRVGQIPNLHGTDPEPGWDRPQN